MSACWSCITLQQYNTTIFASDGNSFEIVPPKYIYIIILYVYIIVTIVIIMFGRIDALYIVDMGDPL